MGEALLTVGLPLSLAYIMFTLGIGLKISDFKEIAKFPKAFLVGLLNQGIFLPIIGFLLAMYFELPPELAVGVVLLALSPGGVTTNLISRLANGNVALSVSLTAFMTIASVITLPIFLNIAMQRFMGAAAPNFSLVQISTKMFLIAVVPLAMGMYTFSQWPDIRGNIEKWMIRVATALFALIVLAALASNWKLVTENIGRLGPVLLCLLVFTLAVGLLSGAIFRLKAQDTTTIAIETGVQNGTLAIAVASLLVAGDQIHAFAMPGALYGLIMYLSLIFALWRRKFHSA